MLINGDNSSILFLLIKINFTSLVWGNIFFRFFCSNTNKFYGQIVYFKKQLCVTCSSYHAWIRIKRYNIYFMYIN